jgi:hypothetical protein
MIQKTLVIVILGLDGALFYARAAFDANPGNISDIAVTDGTHGTDLCAYQAIGAIVVC